MEIDYEIQRLYSLVLDGSRYNTVEVIENNINPSSVNYRISFYMYSLFPAYMVNLRYDK